MYQNFHIFIKDLNIFNALISGIMIAYSYI